MSTSSEGASMIDDRDTRARCTKMIASLRQELDLTPEQVAAYVQAITTYFPDRSTDAQLLSLEDEVAVTRPADQATDPEAQAGASALNALITAILAERGGPNWVKIFRLWAHEDQRLVDIGQQIGLSPSRVSVLLDQMR